MRVAPMGSETGAFASMVISYWEQACALLNYDLLHEDLFFETSGEFFGVREMVKPVVPGFRERFVAKTFCTNLEKAAQRYETGGSHWNAFRSYKVGDDLRQAVVLLTRIALFDYAFQTVAFRFESRQSSAR